MFCFSLRNLLLAAAVSLAPALACAGGITLGSTRIVYPDGQKQVSMSVRNSSDRSSFLVQSWVEQADGAKTQDFIVTPPLYVSGPNNENTLRLMYVGKPARQDEETLYYFNSKAIPAMNKKDMEGKNILLLAAVTRIKLFLRPAGLHPSVDDAPSRLTFHRSGGKMRIDNPTPYHITLAQVTLGGKMLGDLMINPHASGALALPAGAGGEVMFRTINDFGAVTPQKHAALQ